MLASLRGGVLDWVEASKARSKLQSFKPTIRRKPIQTWTNTFGNLKFQNQISTFFAFFSLPSLLSYVLEFGKKSPKRDCWQRWDWLSFFPPLTPHTIRVVSTARTLENTQYARDGICSASNLVICIRTISVWFSWRWSRERLRPAIATLFQFWYGESVGRSARPGQSIQQRDVP